MTINKDQITIKSDSTFLDALKKIETNNRRYIIVLDNNENVSGVLTDGDIRRNLIKGKKLSEKIIFKNSFLFIDFFDNFEQVCRLFREPGIDFLPVLKEKKLVNVIDKEIFHMFLLEGYEYAPEFDFGQLEVKSLELEIFNRPWGFYKTSFNSKVSKSKILVVFPQSEISYQSHNHRDEHWVIISGHGKLRLNDQFSDISSGSYIYIKSGDKHQIINTSIQNQLVISEVQLGDYFGEDDIIRYSDKYGRLNHE